MRTRILNSFRTPYVDSQTLLTSLQEYQKPRDWIARAVANGELLRLRNGFFLIPSQISRDGVYPFEQVANLLYGPSYVSLEWALSLYGFIPEGVRVITSVTVSSNKEYSTPIGTYTYRHISQGRYSIGFTHRALAKGLGGYLIASPEKALADMVHFSCRGLNEEELLEDLLESRRIERSSLEGLNKALMKNIEERYHSRAVTYLTNIVVKL